MNTTGNGEGYNESEFCNKVRELVKRAAYELIVLVLEAYYAGKDPETPPSGKAILLSALAYLILPIDVIPDFLPGGLVDDAAALTTALGLAAAYLNDKHRSMARAWMK